ncbi:MAG: sugar-binding domain-containing protein [Acidimicrobiia bacterium]
MMLSGIWRAAPADDALRREAATPDFDDSSWEAVAVPGHWRSTSAFANEDGPFLYRHHFETGIPATRPGTDHVERSWLVFDGLFYQGDVWCDGMYLGDTEGYFVPHQFEITSLVAERREHQLAVEVTCSRPGDLKAKRNLTGVFQHWDCFDPDWNPGGIWRPVRLVKSGPVRMSNLTVLCREADERHAALVVRVDLDSLAGTTVTLRTVIDGQTAAEEERPLAAGENRVEWNVNVDQPALWWPHALGDQPLHDVSVVVVTDTGDSDQRTVRMGFRHVDMRNWILSVNGERMFLKGANLGPSRMALADATAEEFAHDIALAKDAGLDLVRLHAHVSRPELYEAADRAGMLLWQDFPMQWGYARTVRKQASRQARAMVDLLGHHPSIAIWCGHNEPFGLDVPTEAATKAEKRSMMRRYTIAQTVPTWNRSILDRSVKRSIAKGDETRPVVAHSGVWPHLPQLDGTDSHIYVGWYHGDERDFPDYCRRWPRMARFVSEFGAQAVPQNADFMEPDRWPDLDWDRLTATHGLQKTIFDRLVPPSGYRRFEDWKAATQAYQATMLKHYVETLRRLKYRPTGGFCQFSLADAHPSVTWSVLGHDRQAKAGYHALADACRPVIVVADRLPATLAPGTAIALDVHVVSDLRVPISDAVVTASMSWTGGHHSWRWSGSVDADAVSRIGTISFVAPPAIGLLTLDLELASDTAAASNLYEATITLG